MASKRKNNRAGGSELGALGGPAGRQRVLIVDGHSIIFAWPDLQKVHSRPDSRVSAREMLVRRLLNYQDVNQTKVVVVFDGQGPVATEDTAAGPGLQIFYAARGQTADTIIERLVATYAETYDITVATCDNMERQTVITLGASTIDAQRLAILLEETNRDLADQLKQLRKRNNTNPRR